MFGLTVLLSDPRSRPSFHALISAKLINEEICFLADTKKKVHEIPVRLKILNLNVE